MVEGQLMRRVGLAAILATEAVPQEDVESREGGAARGGNIFLERYDARQAHFEAWAAHHLFIFRDDVDAVEEHCLDHFLPRPQREREVGERTKIRVEHQCRTIIQGHRAPTSPPSILPRLVLTLRL